MVRIRNQTRGSAGEDRELLVADGQEGAPPDRRQQRGRRGEVGDLDASGRPPARRQGGRSRRSRGTPAARQAATACRPICSANGWLASTSRSIARARRNRSRPAAPPKPPTRSCPGSARGAAVRPASELITSRPPCCASCGQREPRPPRIRTRRPWRSVPAGGAGALASPSAHRAGPARRRAVTSPARGRSAGRRDRRS